MTFDVDDRPGADFYPCREPGHVPGCPHGAGGDHESAVRLPHCTPMLGGHSPLCDRNGAYCSKLSTHDGPCTPHGSAERVPWYHQPAHGTPYENCPVCGLHEIHMEAEPRLRPDSCEPCQALAERQQGEDTDR